MHGLLAIESDYLEIANRLDSSASLDLVVLKELLKQLSLELEFMRDLSLWAFFFK